MRTEQTLQTGVLVVFIILAAGCGAPTTAETTASPVERAEQESPASSSSRGWIDGAAEAMARQPVSYLKEVILPCVPVEGSGFDPCSPIPVSVADSENLVGVSTTMLHSLPSFTDVFLSTMDSRNYPNLVPHVVIRGTAKPNTTRCAEYPAKLFSYENNNYRYDYVVRNDRDYLDAHYYHCFVDFRISEYIVGEGPHELTISVYHFVIFPDERPYIDNSVYESGYLNAVSYEGREMILFLGTPQTAAVEAWHIINQFRTEWYVQRDSDEVRAVSYYLDRIVEGYNDHLLSQMDMPLSELIPQIKKAAEERTAITGGRIGAHSSLPLLVTDANKLQDYYGAVGAVYEGDGAAVLPPPAPGGDEPEQPPTQVGEGQPTVASSPVPGDETSPTTTDDAAPSPSGTTTRPTEEPPPPAPTVDTTAPSTTSTTLPQTDASEPTTTTTQPQVEDVAPSTTTTTQPLAEDASSSTTVAPAPPVDDSGAADTTAPLGEGGAPPDEGGGSGLFDEEPVGW